MNEVAEFLKNIVQLNEVYTILGLLAAQIFVGVFTAMIQGNFDVQKFFEFYKKVGVYFASYLGVGIISQVLIDWSGFQAIMFGSICTVIVDKILKNMNEAGLPVPSGIPLISKVLNGVGGLVARRIRKGTG